MANISLELSHVNAITTAIDISNTHAYCFSTFISTVLSCAWKVCGVEMAIALALAGGVGIIHRHQPVEAQAEMVRRCVAFAIPGCQLRILAWRIEPQNHANFGLKGVVG